MIRVYLLPFIFCCMAVQACDPDDPETQIRCDWRDMGAVTPVLNQNNCSACWAFAAIAVVESYQFRKFEKLEKLSVQNVIDCAYKHDPNKLGRCFLKKGHVCGGNPYAALNVIRSSMGGVYNSSVYPWRSDPNSKEEQKNGKCANHPKQTKFPKRLSEPDKAFFRENINQGIKNLILTKGPVLAIIHFPNDWYNKTQPRIYTASCHGDLDHAIAAIGYGRENGIDFWILKNSHGSRWGDKGFIRLAMRPDDDHNDCGFKKNIFYLN